MTKSSRPEGRRPPAEFSAGASAFSWQVKLPCAKTKTYPASGGRALVLWREGEDGEESSVAVARATGSALAKAGVEGFLPENAQELQGKLETLDAEQAWSWLLSTLNRRDLTASEALAKGTRKGFSRASMDAAIERAKRLRFMDEARYVEAFTAAKIGQGWGERRIRQELARRGVDLDEYPEWGSANFGREREVERAKEILQRRSVPQKGPYEKFVRLLAGKGFSLSVAKEAASWRLEREGE